MKEKEILFEMRKILKLRANLDIAKEQKRYMKSRLDFWGIKAPELNQLLKVFFKNYQISDDDEYRLIMLYLFNNAEKREEWYAAIQFAVNFKAFIGEQNLEAWLYMVRKAAWWDITDSISSKLIGPALKYSLNKEKFTKSWIRDQSLWVRRVALIFQLKYKEKTDFPLLRALIIKTAAEDEFFIQKAIGWALRQYSYDNPKAVNDFVQKCELSGLSKREALKVIRRKSLEF